VFTWDFYCTLINKVLKNLKESTRVLLVLFHLFVKFQVQTHYNLDVRKRGICMSLDI
jgi:hypothetical protein